MGNTKKKNQYFSIYPYIYFNDYNYESNYAYLNWFKIYIIDKREDIRISHLPPRILVTSTNKLMYLPFLLKDIACLYTHVCHLI